jgi:hypothetical protein
MINRDESASFKSTETNTNFISAFGKALFTLEKNAKPCNESCLLGFDHPTITLLLERRSVKLDTMHIKLCNVLWQLRQILVGIFQILVHQYLVKDATAFQGG